MRTILVIGLAIVGASLLSFPAVAQQKTVKACQEEWRANKDANQAKGITEKAYVTQCRAGGSAAKPASAPAASSSSQKKTATAPAPASKQQKTVKACQEEWRANKDANQAKGITEKAYVTQCRAGGTAAAPAPAPAQTKTTTAPAPAPAASAPPASTAAQPATTAPAGANQYATEVQAKMRCGSGTIVWANLESKIYHFTGYKDYGGTKSGAYMCERDATSQGMRAAKNEKHP
jgi:cytoskeletal protein RodZ